MATPQRQLTPTAIIQAVLTARTTEQVEKLIELMLAFGLAGGRPIGDRDNNAGTIEIASNPYSALGERMTNGIDAELELAAMRLGYCQPEDWPELPSGPRDAARLLFNVPKAGIADLTEKERRSLALEAPAALASGAVAPAHDPALAICLHAHRVPLGVCTGRCIVLT